jgi:hypothetical protein
VRGARPQNDMVDADGDIHWVTFGSAPIGRSVVPLMAITLKLLPLIGPARPALGMRVMKLQKRQAELKENNTSSVHGINTRIETGGAWRRRSRDSHKPLPCRHGAQEGIRRRRDEKNGLRRDGSVRLK